MSEQAASVVRETALRMVEPGARASDIAASLGETRDVFGDGSQLRVPAPKVPAISSARVIAAADLSPALCTIVPSMRTRLRDLRSELGEASPVPHIRSVDPYEHVFVVTLRPGRRCRVITRADEAGIDAVITEIAMRPWIDEA